MSSSKYSAPRPRKKGTSKPAVAPSVSKAFKSAEFVKDSEDEDEDENEGNTPTVLDTQVTATISAKKLSPLKEANKVANSKPSRAGPFPPKNRKSPTPSSSETGSSDAGSSSNMETPPQEGLQVNALPPKSYRDDVASLGVKSKKTYSETSSHKDSSDSQNQHSTTPKLIESSRKRGENFLSRKKEAQKSTINAKRPEKLRSPSRVSPINEAGRDSSRGSSDQLSSNNEWGEESSYEDTDGPTLSLRNKSQQKRPATHAPLPSYTPPSGFEAASISARPRSEQAQLLSPTSLQGKQIWHITVPQGVGISSLTQVAKSSVQDGSAILPYKGADYGLMAEADGIESPEMLLLPFPKDERYKPSEHRITKTLHLQQLVHPSGALRGFEDLKRFTASKERSHYQRPAPQQPEGLRMRYRPFGGTDSDTSRSDDTSNRAQQAPQFRVPKGMDIASPPKKRKRDKIVADDPYFGQSPKKSRTTGAGAVPLAHVSSTSVKNPSLVKEMPRKQRSPSKDMKSKERKKHRENSKITPVASSNDERKSTSPVSERTPKSTTISNGDVLSPTKVNSGQASSKRKEKSRNKYRGDQPEHRLSVDRYSMAINDDPEKKSSQPNARSDHDRDTTAGGQTSDREALSKIKKERVADERNESKKKSKHEGETPEEKARRRAEKKKREMKMDGVRS